MHNETEMYRSLVDAVQDYSIYMLSPEGSVATWNTGATRIEGYEAPEVIGNPFSMFFPEEDRESGLPEEILSQARTLGRYETEGWRVRKDGTQFWAHATLSTVLNDARELIGFAKVTRDVTAHREAMRQLRHAASTDPLTGMWNRTAFLEEVERWTESSEKFALSIIDLNGFKLVNDTWGHATGDALLRQTAEKLHANEALGVIAARLGGDEFAVAARTPEPDDSRKLASELADAMRTPVELSGETHEVSASVGLATFPSDATSVSELLIQADAAMYDAKQAGSTHPVWYEPGLIERSASRRFLGRQILGAIERGEFVLEYQPQSSLQDAAVVGWEALVRWNHPTLGLLSPGDFIPLAEASGAIVALGAWILREACFNAASWTSEARVAVNVSALQLADRSFFDFVSTAIRESGLDPSRLELEVTESSLNFQRKETFELFSQLQHMGVLIALDDFGSGFSSLDTLLAFGFDRVKVDSSVLHDSLQPCRTRDLLRAILALGHALTANVLVEGVETEAQRELLRAEGFDEIQGFLTGRPGAGPAAGSTAAHRSSFASSTPSIPATVDRLRGGSPADQ